ncbi:MAG: TIGR03621 family F420-dependent LLM class oxidoreductase [Ktedonobacteraceae bacterium]|nr:TIGR03621 family F420-dependent LLM class oxidoreductase [Ktedonobacteraceae bacterium]
MHRAFRFGVQSSASIRSHKEWVTRVRKIEELGYATLLMPDRPSYGGLMPLTALAVAAEATTTLRVGSYVFCNEYRHPLLLGKEVATLDLLSDGRFELGLGAGVEGDDYAQLGIPFESGGIRVSRLEESVQIIKQFFTQESVNFSGKYYTVSGIKSLPRPIQKPHPPIFIAGAGKRLLSLAAREADIIAIAFRRSRQGGIGPTDATPEEKLAWIREAAGERFAHLELAQSLYDLKITDTGTDIVTPPGMPPVPRREMSSEQAAEHLLELRERYGYSYFQVYDGQFENFAPVVARLAGR